jgi:hypothetical protein
VDSVLFESSHGFVVPVWESGCAAALRAIIIRFFWGKPARAKEVQIITEERGRYEFYGRGRDIGEAIRVATKHPPNKFVDVDAREFVRNPSKYSVDGVWLWYDIES